MPSFVPIPVPAELDQLLGLPAPYPRARVFVGNRESVLLSMRVISIHGEPVHCALVALPWVRCQCDGTDHPAKVVVAVEPCGVGRDGARLFWDVGTVRFCSADVDGGDGTEDNGEEPPDGEDGWGAA